MLRLAALVAAAALAVTGPARAQPAPAVLPVVSGAQTKGGEGGRVYTVSTLVDGGPGSLRKALEQPGPRIIKFAVGGVIKLKKPLRIEESRVTVAGETAPSPGITLWGAPVRIWANDVILRHVRVRVGDGPGYDPDDRDGITILGVNDRGKRKGLGPAGNVLIDNCSVSWAIDENVSLWFPGIRGVTIRNTIIAEGLDNSLHPKGPHSMGLLVGSGSRDVLIQGNLFAHNRYRNPVLTPGVTALVVNNLIYDPTGQAVHFYDDGDNPVIVEGDNPTLAIIQGNVARRGTATPKVLNLFGVMGPEAKSRIYLADNDSDGTSAFEPHWPAKAKPLFDPFVDTPPVRVGPAVKIQPSAGTYDAVIKGVGARPWDRDVTDKRIISEVVSRSGGMRDTPPGAEEY